MLPLFESGIPLLLARLRQLPDRDTVTIAYPDEGAWKRFHYQFKTEGYPEVRTRMMMGPAPEHTHTLLTAGGTVQDHAVVASTAAVTSVSSPSLTAALRPTACWPLLQVICTKVRDGAKRIVRLKEGEPAGRHVVIVDDLVQSGGTLKECHALLAALGAAHGEWPRACSGRCASLPTVQ